MLKEGTHRYFSYEQGAFPEISAPAPFVHDDFEEIVVLPLDKARLLYKGILASREKMEGEDPFVAGNREAHSKGVFVYVPPGVEVKKPFTLSYGESDERDDPRVYLFMGEGAKLVWLEKSEGCKWRNAFFDISMEKGSHLTIWSRREGGVNCQSISVSLKRGAQCFYQGITTGGEKVRQQIVAHLLEPEAHVDLKAIAVLGEGSQSHIDFTVRHLAPHTTSSQHVKGALFDNSKSSVCGKIYVAPEAQKTEAYQLTNYLLLDERAIANTQPNLEIFADDVKASHGATIGSLDSAQRFYLSARGIPKREADRLLTRAFCSEMLSNAPDFMGTFNDLSN